MAYENLNVCKEIYLPIPDQTMKRQEYKDRFGIDLKDVFELFISGGKYYLRIRHIFAKVFLVDIDEYSDIAVLPLVNVETSTAYGGDDDDDLIATAYPPTGALWQAGITIVYTEEVPDYDNLEIVIQDQ